VSRNTKHHESIQRDRARSMRNTPTEAEYKLWGFLRCRQLNGVKFRRQAPIGKYIVDFVSYEVKLIIELDGGQHVAQQAYDDRRTRWLESQGFRVMRFWNDDVLNNPEVVVEAISNALMEMLDLPT
jgi:very-short-patch-repair endonuclease